MENPRKAKADIDPMFTDRWSPRSYCAAPLSYEKINILFEAARWAPSCYNEQPWLFLYAVKTEDKELFASLLVAQNKIWAEKAPLLAFILTKKTFRLNNKPNRHACFDAGAAWMSLALQARKIGLYAHAMAGFHIQDAYKKLGVPEDEYEIIAAIAIGEKDDITKLPADLQKMEKPNDRKNISEIQKEGVFKQG